MSRLLARLVPGLRRWHRRWVEPNPRFIDGRWTPEEES